MPLPNKQFLLVLDKLETDGDELPIWAEGFTGAVDRLVGCGGALLFEGEVDLAT